MRIMGLDLGDKTIGIAVSDPMGWTAQSVEVILRGESLKKEIARLGELIKQYEIEMILLGLPKNMNGTLGERSHKSIEYSEFLKKKFGLPVEMWDERLSTVSAERILLEADMSRAKRKKNIDKLAAALILQGYLDFKANKM
jgi:putative Holliday junction resolvase